MKTPFKKITIPGTSSVGYAELKNNCWNFSIQSIDRNLDVLTNEYLAGFIQGQLQGRVMIEASRNNSWDNTYLCDPSHIFPREPNPSEAELKRAADCLKYNFAYTVTWIVKHTDNPTAQAISRLLSRMYGIYDGAMYKGKLSDFELKGDIQTRIMNADSMNDLKLGYGETELSLLDIYFINAQLDMFDVVSSSLECTYGTQKADRCSAFVKRTKDDIFWAHNSWCGFLSQSHTLTYTIFNGTDIDFITQNSYCPGQFSSNMDFGFNGRGICFYETTHRYSASEPKPTAEGIWLCWRAAAAEMFSTNIEDFYRHLTADNTGTYLNGYAVIDVNANDTALIEMSRTRFTLFYSANGDEYKITEEVWKKDGTKEYNTLSKDDYNPELLCKKHIFGINYPIAYNVSNDLLSRDNRPKRRIQFREQIEKAIDMESGKKLITYVEEGEPLSIYGRWDLGHGNAGGYGKTIPDGAVDSKIFSAKKVKQLLSSLKFEPTDDVKQQKHSFWMLYGTPKMRATPEGKKEPFIWSKSQWKDFKAAHGNDYVPDKLSGKWEETNLFMK